MAAKVSTTGAILLAAGALAAGMVVGASISQPADAPPDSQPPSGPHSPAATSGPAPTAAGPTRAAAPPRATPPAARRTPRPSNTPPGRLRSMDVIDGDTVVVGDVHVRLLGIDTPEQGECGFDAAKAFTQRFLRSGGWISNRSGHDQYGRLLASVSNQRGRDLGAAEIHRGLANARYDSTDGYDWHPHEQWYRRLDARTPHVCGGSADALGGP